QTGAAQASQAARRRATLCLSVNDATGLRQMVATAPYSLQLRIGRRRTQRLSHRACHDLAPDLEERAAVASVLRRPGHRARLAQLPVRQSRSATRAAADRSNQSCLVWLP